LSYRNGNRAKKYSDNEVRYLFRTFKQKYSCGTPCGTPSVTGNRCFTWVNFAFGKVQHGIHLDVEYCVGISKQSFKAVTSLLTKSSPLSYSTQDINIKRINVERAIKLVNQSFGKKFRVTDSISQLFDEAIKEFSKEDFEGLIKYLHEMYEQKKISLSYVHPKKIFDVEVLRKFKRGELKFEISDKEQEMIDKVQVLYEAFKEITGKSRMRLTEKTEPYYRRAINNSDGYSLQEIIIMILCKWKEWGRSEKKSGVYNQLFK